MLYYPKAYDLLDREELEYTTGGSEMKVALAGIGFVGFMVSSFASGQYRNSISKKLRAQDPEKYQSDPDRINWALIGDIYKTYFLSAGGIVITLGQIASLGCTVASVIA